MVIHISSTSAKELAYKSLIRPSLEYTCSAWDPYNKGKIDQLEMVQHRAANWKENNGSCYFITAIRQRFSDEEIVCSSRNATMYVFRNQQEWVS
jgi:hypothetical protein